MRRKTPRKVRPDDIDQALEAIANGQSLRSCAARLGVAATSLYVAVQREAPEHYARAREAQAEFFADRICDVAEDTLQGRSEPAAARVAIDAWKWIAGKQSPKRFGERVELSGPAGGPIPFQRVERVIIDPATEDPDG